MNSRTLSNIYNILLCASNFMAIYPLTDLWYSEDYVTWTFLVFLTLFSAVSHLFESHKHGMYGFGTPPYISYILNRFDVYGCVLLVMRIFYLLYHGIWPIPDYEIMYCTVCAIWFMIVSEYDKYNRDLHVQYVVCHIIWHCLVYYTMHMYLEKLST